MVLQNSPSICHARLIQLCFVVAQAFVTSSRVESRLGLRKLAYVLGRRLMQAHVASAELCCKLEGLPSASVFVTQKVMDRSICIHGLYSCIYMYVSMCRLRLRPTCIFRVPL